MDIFPPPDKPVGGFLQKITGYQSTKRPQQSLYLSPSSVHFPRLDSQGNHARLDESTWDKQLHNIRDYPKLQVVQKDGGWFALNCAQLQLFQKWEREGKCSKVKVDIVSIHHVPPMLRKLMIVGSDRKHFKMDISDKTHASEESECRVHSILQEVSLTNNDSANSCIRNCDSNKIALQAQEESNHVTIKYCEPHTNTSRDLKADHVTELGASPTQAGLTSSKSDPYGTVLKDSEENEIEFKDILKGEMLYKTLSSFQLDKESGTLEFAGVQTARGYHKVHQADSNDDTDDDTDDDSSDVDDDDVSDVGDDVDDDVTSEGTDDSGSVYSNDVGSELGWTDEDDVADCDDDDTDPCSDVTDSESGSETGSNTEKLDENESLL